METPGFILLLIFLALGSLMTRWGYRRKHSLGTAEGKKGRRGATQSTANCLVGCIFAFLYFLSDQSYLFAVGFTGAFATALSDTASSELEPLYGRAPRSAITWKPVSPGIKGGISLEGTLFGIFGSLLVAGLALPLQFIPTWGIPFIVVMAFLGNLSESVVWSLTANPKKWVHHGLNLLIRRWARSGRLFSCLFFPVFLNEGLKISEVHHILFHFRSFRGFQNHRGFKKPQVVNQ